MRSENEQWWLQLAEELKELSNHMLIKSIYTMHKGSLNKFSPALQLKYLFFTPCLVSSTDSE